MVFEIDIGNSELEDDALVTRRSGRAWNISLLRLGGEDCQDPDAGVELGVIVAGHLRVLFQNRGVEPHQLFHVFRDEAGIDERWRLFADPVASARGLGIRARNDKECGKRCGNEQRVSNLRQLAPTVTASDERRKLYCG